MMTNNINLMHKAKINQKNKSTMMIFKLILMKVINPWQSNLLKDK